MDNSELINLLRIHSDTQPCQVTNELMTLAANTIESMNSTVAELEKRLGLKNKEDALTELVRVTQIMHGLLQWNRSLPKPVIEKSKEFCVARAVLDLLADYAATHPE